MVRNKYEQVDVEGPYFQVPVPRMPIDGYT